VRGFQVPERPAIVEPIRREPIRSRTLRQKDTLRTYRPPGIAATRGKLDDAFWTSQETESDASRGAGHLANQMRRIWPEAWASPLIGGFCCKSLFAQVTKNSPGRRRDVRAKMWGTSPRDHELMGDLGNGTEATKIGGCGSDRLIAGNLAPSNFGVLQQNLRRSGQQGCTAVMLTIDPNRTMWAPICCAAQPLC
jgi:hypothetical protein